jgi:16S rRNA G527 N7-methylase RsmG
MGKEQGAWVILLILSLMLIDIGSQGGLGIFFAILFSPSHVNLIED